MVKNILSTLEFKKIKHGVHDNVNKKEVIKYFLNVDDLRNWKILKVSFSSLSVPFLRCKFNCTVKIQNKSNNEIYEGHSEGNDKYSVVYKGFSEAYERRIVYENRSRFETSNGYASHHNLEKACINSFYELLERDVILYSWYNKNSPLSVIVPQFSQSGIKYLNKYGYQVNFYKLPISYKKASGFHVIFCLIKPLKHRNFFNKLLFPNRFEGRLCGFGCSANLSKAVWKAYREAALNAWAIFLDESLSRKEFSSDKLNQFHSHYYYDPKNNEAFEFLENVESEYKFDFNLQGQTDDELNLVTEFIRGNDIDFKWHVLSTKSDSVPFHVVKAECPQFQELWFGHRYDRFNPLRMPNIKEIKSVQSYPHPIS